MRINRLREYWSRWCKEPLVLDTQNNAEKQVRGFIKHGHDHLVDDKGVPVEFKAWNMVKRTYSDRVQPFSNQEIAESSVQTVRVSREIAPIKGWAPAKKGTNEEFSGIMAKDFPELTNLTDEQVDRIVGSLRRRELDE